MSGDVTGRAQMVRSMCAAVDRGDAEDFAKWFHDDATYTFGNGETITGRTAIAAATAGAVAALPWVRHTIREITDTGDRLFCHFTIETAAPEGKHLALPCMTVISLAGMQVADYTVYMDFSPAMAGDG
ncbi:nuclear transport factor 2 family protein [Amycolatopsis sp. NPDC006125]|uniref:nuclear transport factor 2 family protein n=1 Tax=Amycolatopsis sp. NPDC006125 TaxID=3156730 RepID=UPI0033BE8996